MTAEYNRLESNAKQNPRETASIFSILSFWWVGKLLAIGNKRPLDTDDLFPLLDEDKTRPSVENLQQRWNEATATGASRKGGNGHRLFGALIAMFSCADYMFILSTTLLDSVGNILQIVFLSLLLPELMKSSDKELSWTPYVYASGICLSSLVRFLARHQSFNHAYLMALRWKSATIGIIYKKVKVTVEWMTDWLIARLIGWLIDWLIDWLIVWWVGWLIDWLIDPLTDSFIHYLEPTWPSGKGIGLEIRRSRYVFKSLSDHWSLLLGRPWFNVSSVMLVNFIQNDANIFLSFSRFLIKSHWSKRWQFHSWKLISHQLQFCPL